MLIFGVAAPSLEKKEEIPLSPGLGQLQEHQSSSWISWVLVGTHRFFAKF